MLYLNRDDKRQQLREWHERSGKGLPCGQVEHMFDLDREFPAVDMFGPRCISAHVGLGWSNILRHALAAISDAGGRITQVKQKFGELRVYWEPPEERRRAFLEWIDGGRVGQDPYLDPHHVAANDAVAHATALSRTTCENCGLSIDPLWRQRYQTLCDGCSK